MDNRYRYKEHDNGFIDDSTLHINGNISSTGSGSCDDPVILGPSPHPLPANINPWSLASKKSMINLSKRKSTANDSKPLKKHKVANISVMPQSKVKTEDEDLSTPHNHVEYDILQQLRQMGFTNDEESLIGIRSTGDISNRERRIDAAVMFIVAQREEAEDARKLDVARQMSEMEREQQLLAEGREKTIALKKSTISHILNCKCFPNSALLSQPTFKSLLQEQRKEFVIKILQLEQKAMKWYGIKYSQGYFSSVETKLKNLEELIEELENAMYSLKEQEKGVPKIFREAQKPEFPNGADLGSDDEVVIVEDIKSNPKAVNIEVIEID
mmetsp:Transcript_53470/g.64473  ORF Transcript_53470/g.64473 Transcript_53470/m.64473 type:complete len:327 (-) Transcript_53470:52-1032(-)